MNLKNHINPLIKGLASSKYMPGNPHSPEQVGEMVVV